MSLNESMPEIFQRLEGWAGFPKYALERRLDIFLTPYLEEFFGPGGDVTLVAPEFPILSEIDKLVGRGDAGPELQLDEVDARTVNVDYLLFRKRPSPAWLFVELKTDANSFSEKQLGRYKAARTAGMGTLLKHIREKVAGEPGDKFFEKYARVLQAVDAVNAPAGAAIEIVYLAPKRPENTVPAAEWKPGNPAARFHSLAEFATMEPKRHTELWSHVRKLLGRQSDR